MSIEIDNIKSIDSYESITNNKDLQKTYNLAKKYAKEYGLKHTDLIDNPKKIFKLFTEPELYMENTAAVILLTIHYNLCMGTIVEKKGNRKDLDNIIKDLENFDIIGGYMLTELGYGNNVFNMKTTATYNKNTKEFIINTPSVDAQKWMPPTFPISGIPKIAVVFARLIVNDKFEGIHPFIVPLNDGNKMYNGIKVSHIGKTGIRDTLDHALTFFDNVRIPKSNFLGGLNIIDDMDNFHSPILQKDRFLYSINRVHSGKISLIYFGVTLAKYSMNTYFNFSRQRQTFGSNFTSINVYEYTTQKLPIYMGISRIIGVDSFLDYVVNIYEKDQNSEHMIFLISISKIIGLKYSLETVQDILTRCGSQGHFTYNGFVRWEAEIRAAITAEGDNLIIALKALNQIITGQGYNIPDISSFNLTQTINNDYEPIKIFINLENIFINYLKQKYHNYLKKFNDKFVAWNKILPEGLDLIKIVSSRMVLEHYPKNSPFYKFFYLSLYREFSFWLSKYKFLSNEFLDDCYDSLINILGTLDDHIESYLKEFNKYNKTIIGQPNYISLYKFNLSKL